MPDHVTLHTASELIQTGKGKVTGITISTTSTSAVECILWDSLTATGTKILDIILNLSQSPVVIYFSDANAPRFSTGLYITVGSPMTAMVWDTLPAP